MQLPEYLEFEISQHHIKETLIEALTDIIIHEMVQVGGFIRLYLIYWERPTKCRRSQKRWAPLIT